MVHIALPFGLTIGANYDVIKLIIDFFSFTGLGVIADFLGAGFNAELTLSPSFDMTLDSSWLFNAWNQLVLLYAQSF